MKNLNELYDGDWKIISQMDGFVKHANWDGVLNASSDRNMIGNLLVFADALTKEENIEAIIHYIEFATQCSDKPAIVANKSIWDNFMKAHHDRLISMDLLESLNSKRVEKEKELKNQKVSNQIISDLYEKLRTANTRIKSFGLCFEGYKEATEIKDFISYLYEIPEERYTYLEWHSQISKGGRYKLFLRPGNFNVSTN